MKYVITSVKDALKGYSTFDLNQNLELAKRNFSDTVNSSSVVALHLPDFSLYKMGEYDSETGVINSEGCPMLLISASDVHTQKEGA